MKQTNLHASPDSCCGAQAHAMLERTRPSLLTILQVWLRRASQRSPQSYIRLHPSLRNPVKHAG